MNNTKKHKHITADKLIKIMRKKLDKHRYIHTLGVSFTAASLAMKYGADIENARVAGMLHDCAKSMSGDELIEYCNSNKIQITDHEFAMPYLLHAKAGSSMAKHEYGIKNKDILNAIRFHTTGRPGMSLLEKIIYIADYMEPGRREAPDLSIVRKLAFEDIDRCLYTILKDTLSYLDSKKAAADPATRDTYIYYRRLNTNKE